MSPSLPTPDLYIAALGRSGSTMLANLFTTPPRRWVAIEPRFTNASTGNDILEQARSMEMPVEAEEWALGKDETPAERISRVFAPRLRRLDRWGLKEVRPDLLAPTLQAFDPRHIVVLVRDLRSAAVSLAEKSERDADPRYGEEWLRSYLTASPRAILEVTERLSGYEHRVVRYEDLVTDTNVRMDLEGWLDWPLDGRPDRNLELYGRRREIDLHRGVVTDLALRGRNNAPSGLAAELAEWAHREHTDFQTRFGYV